jgi:hypothetical protein
MSGGEVVKVVLHVLRIVGQALSGKHSWVIVAIPKNKDIKVDIVM